VASPEKPQKNNQPSPAGESNKVRAEDWLLIAGVTGFVIFLWIMALLFVPLLTQGRPLSLPPRLVEIAATRGFVLPPTWTPAPTPVIIPTITGTPVFDGSQPTRVYTPRPTSLPGVPLVFNNDLPLRNRDLIDLARIMQGESPGDKDAAYYVGWVAKNRLLHAGYGDTFAMVSSGFFGYRADIQPNEDFLQIARNVIRAREDPTGGSLYALSRTDITKLGVPPQRADVTRGEWFFFRTWPLQGR